MRIEDKDWDKLTDVKKILINSYLSNVSGLSNTAMICSIIFASFAIHNIFLLNSIIPAILFVFLSLLFAIVGFKIKLKAINHIKSKYFEVKTRRVR